MLESKSNSLFSTFLRYAVPSVLAMWVFSFYTMVDGIFVAKAVGENALAAVNISIPLVNTLFAISLCFAIGSSTLISIAFAKREEKYANQLFTLNTIVLIVVSLVISFAAIVFLPQLANFLGATDLTREYVCDYLKIILFFSVFFIVAYALEVLIKTDGFPVLATIGAVLSALTNIILDYVFVILWGWGVSGAALATGLSQVAMAIFFFAHFLGKKSNLKFTKPKIKLGIYKKILPLGLSDCLTELSTGLVIFIFNRTILHYIGDSGIVSYTIITYVNTFVLMTMIGLTQGIQPQISYNHGAGDKKTVRKLLRFGLGGITFCAILLFALTQLLAEPLVSIFVERGHTELMTSSTDALRAYALSFLLVGFNIIIAGFFVAIERPRSSFFITTARGIVLVPIALAIAIFSIGATGIWYASLLSEAICLILSGLLLYYYKKAEKRMLPSNL